jgi:hypothetical protein
MRKMAFLLLATSYFSYSQSIQKVEPYQYGKNGMEYIVKSNSGKMVVVSTFNSRPTIIEEVAEKMYIYFRDKTPNDGDKITLLTKNAIVKGTCYIKTKDHLTSVEFYYESVEWDNGITEVYHNPDVPVTSAIADSDE